MLFPQSRHWYDTKKSVTKFCPVLLELPSVIQSKIGAPLWQAIGNQGPELMSCLPRQVNFNFSESPFKEIPGLSSMAIGYITVNPMKILPAAS